MLRCHDDEKSREKLPVNNENRQNHDFLTPLAAEKHSWGIGRYPTKPVEKQPCMYIRSPHVVVSAKDKRWPQARNVLTRQLMVLYLLTSSQ